MAIQLKQRVTLQEFEDFISLPANSDKVFEYIDGEIVSMPTNPYASKIAAKILIYIGMYLLENDIGHVTGADGGYNVGGERFAPDVAYISYDRQKKLARSGYNPNPPELAVEVISDPSNAEEQRKLRLKLSSYMATGMVVWVVNPQDRRVEVHQADKVAQELDETDILILEGILPGFRLDVKDIFPSED